MRAERLRTIPRNLGELLGRMQLSAPRSHNESVESAHSGNRWLSHTGALLTSAFVSEADRPRQIAIRSKRPAA